jgi:uncharacterized protein YbaA (DUF1428 family)
MSYVDGFVLVVPKKNLAAYKKMASAAGKIWKKHGALQYVECAGEDLNPPGMEMDGKKALTFPKMTKIKPTETVVFSFIVYKTRKHRDAVNAKVMKDPGMGGDEWKDKPMPFDLTKMAYGGFMAMVEL